MPGIPIGGNGWGGTKSKAQTPGGGENVAQAHILIIRELPLYPTPLEATTALSVRPAIPPTIMGSRKISIKGSRKFLFSERVILHVSGCLYETLIEINRYI